MKLKIFLVLIAVLVLAYLLGPAPNKPLYNNQLPQNFASVAAVTAYVSQRENRPDIKPGNQSKIIWANDILKEPTSFVLLYLHGFSASPVEGEPVYPDFAKKYGVNAYAPRLVWHGIDTVEPLLNYNAEILWNDAKMAFVVAKSMGKKVIIMSTSTGGTLALKLAAEYPEDIAGLINLSANIRPKAWNAVLLNKPWGLQIARAVLGGEERVLEKKDTIYHKYWNINYRIESLVQLEELVETTMIPETFERVTCPVLDLYYYKNETEQDPVVNVEKIREMHKMLGTPANQKREIAIPNAQTHVIGNKFYSKALPEITLQIDLFASEVLGLKPLTLAP